MPMNVTQQPGPPVLSRRMHPFAVLRDDEHYARFSNLALAIDVVLFYSERDVPGPNRIVDEATYSSYDVFDCKRERNRSTQPGMVAASSKSQSQSRPKNGGDDFSYAY